MGKMEDPFVTDEDFFLRCAATYNWNAIVERCEYIQTIFSVASPDPHHSLRVAAAAHQLQARDQWGNAAIHLACFHSAPTAAIVALLRAAGAANPTIQLTSFRTNDNSTPLLIACATRAAPDTIQTLLNPPVDTLVRGTLHASSPDDSGSTPLSELWTLYEKRKSRPLAPKAVVSNENQLWTNVEAILQAGWNSNGVEEEEQQDSLTMYHCFANVAESSPPELTDRILEHYPDTSAVMHRGMLPLHIAVSKPSSYSHLKLKQQRAFSISKLLSLYPEAARVVVGGKSNTNRQQELQTPFCRAIASGLDWNVASSEGPLCKLWQYAPEAIPSRDMVTGLYPFLLAATVQRRRTNNSVENDSDATAVNNVYNILRLYPQAIQDLLSNES